MNIVTRFFHELRNPHCEICAMEETVKIDLLAEANRNPAVEALERQVAMLNQQNQDLLNRLINPQAVIQETTTEEPQRVLRRMPLSFNKIRPHLEAESRKAAEALKNAAVPDSEQVKNNEVNGNAMSSDVIAPTESLSQLEALVLTANVNHEASGTKQ